MKEECIMKTREAYIDKMAKQLKEWSARIDELEVQIGTAGTEMRTEYQKRIVDIKERRDALSKKLTELRSSSGDAWKTLTAGMDKSWVDFKDALKSAKDKLKKAA